MGNQIHHKNQRSLVNSRTIWFYYSRATKSQPLSYQTQLLHKLRRMLHPYTNVSIIINSSMLFSQIYKRHIPINNWCVLPYLTFLSCYPYPPVSHINLDTYKISDYNYFKMWKKQAIFYKIYLKVIDLFIILIP